MTTDEIRQGVLQCLKELVGDRDVLEITDKIDPIRDLGLDSEDGVEMACALSEKFGYHIPDDLNPLVDDAKQRGRRVGEIVVLVAGLLSSARV